MFGWRLRNWFCLRQWSRFRYFFRFKKNKKIKIVDLFKSCLPSSCFLNWRTVISVSATKRRKSVFSSVFRFVVDVSILGFMPFLLLVCCFCFCCYCCCYCQDEFTFNLIRLDGHSLDKTEIVTSRWLLWHEESNHNKMLSALGHFFRRANINTSGENGRTWRRKLLIKEEEENRKKSKRRTEY